MDHIRPRPGVTIVIAEDNDADFHLAERAFNKLHLTNEIKRAVDGQELMDYLSAKVLDDEQSEMKISHVVLLDLNMPRMDGREVLKLIKSHEKMKHIPIIVMTTSKEDEDVIRSYKLGVNAYIRKPFDQNEFVEVLATFKRFWLEIVELPAT